MDIFNDTLKFKCIRTINPTEEAKHVAEGKFLYKSEMASWYGTDLFLENFKDREKCWWLPFVF